MAASFILMNYPETTENVRILLFELSSSSSKLILSVTVLCDVNDPPDIAYKVRAALWS